MKINERQAGIFALQMTQDMANFITAIKQLASTNLSNIAPHPCYVFINCSNSTRPIVFVR
jgi:hypothetical protein